MSDLDDFLNEGLDVAIEQATGTPVPASAPAPAPAAPRSHPSASELFAGARTATTQQIAQAASATQQQPSQGSVGGTKRGRGGVIRNETTRVVAEGVANPISDRRPNQRQSKGVSVPPPNPDQDFRAHHPELTGTALMTGMDLNATTKPLNRPRPQVAAPAPAPALQAPQPTQQNPGQPGKAVSMETTIRQLLQLAFDNGGSFNIGNSKFILSVRFHNQPVTLPSAGSQASA